MKHYIYYPIILSALAACSTKPEYDAQGTFEATEVTVSAETTGKILYLEIEQGDRVTAGQQVGRIDSTQLVLQKIELESQRSALEKSRPNLDDQTASLKEQISGTVTERDRIARLLAEGAATQQQLDNLNTRLASLKGQLAAQKSSVSNNISTIDKQIEALTVKTRAIDDQISKCAIISPISGIVLNKIAEAGEVASFGKHLFKVADMSNIYLRAYFTSDQLATIKLGRKVKVMADYGGGNEKEYEGVVTFISPQSEFTPKTIQTKDSRANLVYAVKIAVRNDGLLKIGMTGNVYVGNRSK